MKKTPLYQWHVDNGANMAEFGSYQMPLWYPQGVKSEHLSVLETAGLFDTSHMACVLVKGAGGRALLQKAFTKDLECCLGAAAKPLCPGRCVYGLFLRENGHVIDDAIVYQLSDTFYMVVVNAGMGGTVSEHLRALDETGGVEIQDLTDSLGKIDIQGPDAAMILSRHIDSPETVFQSMPYFSFKGWFEDGAETAVLLKDKTPILLSRTGYTGEFGFEIFIAPEHVEKLWRQLVDDTQGGATPCGLAARDSLRAGAVLPLSHQDIGEWLFANNPWPFALPHDGEGGFTKSFVGASALQDQGEANKWHTYPFAGFDPRKIPVNEHSGVLDENGDRIGEILTCTTDMAIGRVEGEIVSVGMGRLDRPEGFKPKGLCCGFVRVAKTCVPGETVFLTDGKRKIKVEIREDVRPGRTARRPLKEMI